jgi:hypothetical protein
MRSCAVIAVAFLACQAKSGDTHNRPQSWAALVKGTTEPRLLGPLAELKWGTNWREAVKSHPEHTTLDAGVLTYGLVGGAGDKPLLESVTIRATDGSDARNPIEIAWGPPDLEWKTIPVWLGPDTRASLESPSLLVLSAYTPLAAFLGGGEKLGFEGSRQLTDITEAEVASRFASVKQAGTTLQIGYDEVDQIFISYTVGPDRRVDSFSFYLQVPEALPERGALILKRFGLTAPATGPAWTPFGSREVNVIATDTMWRVAIRRGK